MESMVPPVGLILPADFGVLQQGATNTLSWTAFAPAVGYLLEVIPDPPGFDAPNPAGPQSVTLALPPGSSTEAAGVVEWAVSLPAGLAPSGTRLQWRIFPTDGAGQILTGAVTSVVRVSPALTMMVVPSRGVWSRLPSSTVTVTVPVVPT